MYQILDMILRNFEHKSNILLCKRYRDDIILLYKGSELEIHQLFESANRSHKHLKFTYEISTEKISFLDTLIYKGGRFEFNQKLDIKTFTKKTETFQYLDRTSCHPNSTFKAFIKGESIRHLRNTSDVHEFNQLLYSFKDRLLKRGYKNAEIDETFNEIQKISRKDVLKDKQKKKKRTLVFVTKYNPGLKHLKKMLLKHWQELNKNPRCKQIFATKPIIAYKRSRNIGEIVKNRS